MTTIELKNRVIDKVNDLTDDELLMDLIKLIDDSSDENYIYRLSDKHKIAINVATDQIRQGNSLTNQQADKEINEWLNK